MSKNRKPVIRTGDRVRIVTSRFIKRVGYPVIWTDIVRDVADDPRTLAAYHFLDTKASTLDLNDFPVKTNVKFPDDDNLYMSDPLYRQFARVVAMKRVGQMGFGGNDRSLHYYKTVERVPGLGLVNIDTDEERLDMTDHIVTVIGKRVVKTGKRFAPWHGASYDGEYDWEPGGLENEQTHVLLDTPHGLISRDDVEVLKDKNEKAADAIDQLFGKLYEPISMKRLKERLSEHDPELVQVEAIRMISSGKLKIDPTNDQILPRLNRIPSLAELRARFAGIPDQSGKGAIY